MSGKGKLAVLGMGGHGRVVAEAAVQAGWREIAFFDDARHNDRWTIFGRHAGTSTDLLENPADFDGVIIAIGNNSTRARLGSRLAAGGTPLATIIHPAASVSPSSRIGSGTVILAGATVVTGAEIGMGCIVNTGASVDHDCQIGDWVHISPGARVAGDVTVGDMAWIGIGSAIREGTRVGSAAIVGAGAAVVDDVADGTTVVGNPARPMSRG